MCEYGLMINAPAATARRLTTAVTAAAAVTTLLLTGTPAASAGQCADVELVFARGTSEAPGIGRVGQALANTLSQQLGGRSMDIYAVNYPASYDFLGAADGAADATNHIATLAQQCPQTQVVLGGYSQGAAVVDMLVGIPPLGDKLGDIGSAPPLPGSLASKVSAVAVFGNPATKFGNPVTAGNLGGRSIDMCSDGDPICSAGRNPFAHTNYESGPMPGEAAGFIAGLI